MLLSENEVNKRLIRLRNLENLHLKARERIIWLEKENEKLRKRNKRKSETSFHTKGRYQSKSPKLKIIQLKTASIVAKNSKGNQFEFSLRKTSLCQFKKSS